METDRQGSSVCSQIGDNANSVHITNMFGINVDFKDLLNQTLELREENAKLKAYLERAISQLQVKDILIKRLIWKG